MTQTLFDKGKAEQPSPGEVAAARAMEGNPRLRVPQRNQVEIHWASLDELLEPEHPARMVWACVCGLDLHCWLKTIKAVEGVAGRDATDPRLLVALWGYAPIEGGGGARGQGGGGGGGARRHRSAFVGGLVGLCVLRRGGRLPRPGAALRKTSRLPVAL